MTLAFDADDAVRQIEIQKTVESATAVVLKDHELTLVEADEEEFFAVTELAKTEHPSGSHSSFSFGGSFSGLSASRSFSTFAKKKSYNWNTAESEPGSLWGRPLPERVYQVILSKLLPHKHLAMLASCSSALRKRCNMPRLWIKVDLSNMRSRSRHLVNGLSTSRFAHTRNLDLSGVRTCNDDVVSALSRYCTSLTSLSLKCFLDAGPKMTDVGMRVLADSMCALTLTSLDLTWWFF